MKGLVAHLIMLMLLVSPVAFVNAQEEGKKKEGNKDKGEEVSLRQYTVVGVVQSKEVTNKKGETRRVYVIEAEDGVVFRLPLKGKKAKQYVGKRINVVAEGVDRAIMLKKITTIEEVE